MKILLRPHRRTPPPTVERTCALPRPYARTHRSAPSSTHLRTPAPAPAAAHLPPHISTPAPPSAAHLSTNIFPSELIGTYRSQSELIGRYPISSDKFRLVPITSDTLLRTYHSPPPIPCPHFSAPTFPSQRTHAFPLPYAHPLRSAPRSRVCTLSHSHTIRTPPPHRTFVPFSAEGTVRLYDGNGAVLPYEQIVVPMLSERLFGGVWEKSIGCPRKVYRVFPKSL